MLLSEYQQQAMKTAVFEGVGTKEGLDYPVLGLVSETGELAGKIKKILRGDTSLEAVRDDLLAECGDVLWYCAAVDHCVGTEYAPYWALPKALATNEVSANQIPRRLILHTLYISNHAGQIARHLHASLWTVGYDLSLISKSTSQIIDSLDEIVFNLGTSLNDVAEANLAKLADRAARGVIKGAGDHR